MKNLTLECMLLALGVRVSQGFSTTDAVVARSSFIKSTNSIKAFSLFAQKHDADKPEDNEEKIITREMFLRDMLADPKSASITDGEISASASVKRKKKNGKHYRTLDNRDNLPFLVKVQTPDPYTSNAKMKKEAKENTKRAAEKNKNKKNGEGSGKRRTNLLGVNGKDSIASSIYSRGEDGSMQKIVGEFSLDKSTNCGDIIEVGDGTEFQVQKARCQYKYAGGQRFVMIRKILEVKEIKRVLIEKEVKELFDKDIDHDEGEDENNLTLE